MLGFIFDIYSNVSYNILGRELVYVLHIRDDYVESQILLQERGTFLKIPQRYLLRVLLPESNSSNPGYMLDCA